MRTIYFEIDIPKILLAKALRPIWPAVVYSPLSPTRCVDIPDQPLPGSNWIRVRNRLCGICATDLHLLLLETDPKIAAAALPGSERPLPGP
jgi:D-arabinose 1-dehydrogenase-like Zn-dependent alcohol dehydrogenase